VTLSYKYRRKNTAHFFGGCCELVNDNARDKQYKTCTINILKRVPSCTSQLSRIPSCTTQLCCALQNSFKYIY